MAVVDISFVGDRKLERAFQKLPLRLEIWVARRAFVKVGAMLRKAIRDRTPVLTGMTKRNIKSVAGKGRRNVVARYVRYPTRKELGIPENAKHFPPAAMEYGHGSVRGVASMRRGFDAVEETALDKLKEEIRIGIDKAWKRA